MWIKIATNAQPRSFIVATLEILRDDRPIIDFAGRHASVCFELSSNPLEYAAIIDENYEDE